MERFWKRISGLFFASLAAVALTGKANAEGEEAALPDPAPTAAVEPAAEEGPVFPSEDAAPEAEEEPAHATEDTAPEAAPAEAEEDALPGETGETVEADKADEEAVGTGEAAEEHAVLRAAPAELVPEPEAEPAAEDAAPTSFGLQSAPAGEALSEEAPADESVCVAAAPAETPAGELVLVGNAGPQTITSETEITIKTAGFQHIASLVSGGDVSIIGTGILLVDEVDLAEGCGVYLQSVEEIYGKNGGTAALFVLTEEKDGVRTYTLFNGTYADGNGEHVIPAILDEEYEIPAGISLVVPEGGALVMQSVNTLVEEIDGETFVTYSTETDPEPREGAVWECIGTAPVLTVARGARMIVEKGASLLLNAAEHGGGSFFNTPVLIVQGLMELDGSVSRGEIQIDSTGDVKGTGFFEGSTQITVKGGRETAVTALNVSGKDRTALVRMEAAQADVSTLTTQGRVYMRFLDDLSIGSILIKDDSLTILNDFLDVESTLTIGEKISGAGSMVLMSGEILLPDEKACTVEVVSGGWSSNVVWEGVWLPGSMYWDYLGHFRAADGGILRYENGSLGADPLIPLVGQPVSDGNTVLIPVASGNYREHSFPLEDKGNYTEFNYIEWAAGEDDEPLFFQCRANTEITYSMLAEDLGETFTHPDYVGDIAYTYLVETCVDGIYDYVLFNPHLAEFDPNGQSVKASDVVQICRLRFFYVHDPAGGGTFTATTTAYTGTGILGGSGAGSLTGGPRRLAFPGGKTDAPDPDPDPDPTPNPDPAPAQPVSELRIWTEAPAQEDGCYQLHIEQGGKALSRLTAPVTVRMEYTPAAGMESKPLFAVFRDANGGLTAFEATYDPVTGTLSFAADIAGEFIVVAFAYDGELFTEEFYRALAELDAVRALLA